VRLPLRIDVHLMDGARVSYIEGNRDHPVNKGVLCAKGSRASCRSTRRPPARAAPAHRPPRLGQFKEISWDEALDLAVSWLKPIRDTAPEKLAFFTGRDQSQSFTASGPRPSAPPTTPATAASAPSTWPRPAS
jgi:anaerobic selenocysteine-containing dehydrogenase